METSKINDLPASAALAYLGDAVFSLMIRKRLVMRGLSHAKDLNLLSLSYVTADAQADMLDKILPLLTEEEEDIYRRAANSNHLAHPKHTKMSTYRKATGFEALFGALYYKNNTPRLDELFNAIYSEEKENDTEN